MPADVSQYVKDRICPCDPRHTSASEEHRFPEAKQTLETTDDAVDAVGRAVGYEGAAWLGRIFKTQGGFDAVSTSPEVRLDAEPWHIDAL